MADVIGGSLTLVLDLIDRASGKLDAIAGKATRLDGVFSSVGKSFSLSLPTSEVKQFGDAWEGTVVRANIKAQLLTQGIFALSNAFLGLGRAATQGYAAAVLDEKQDIQATSYLYNQGVGAKPGQALKLEDSQAFYQEVNNSLAELAAKLPGTTRQYVQINKALQDNLLPFFKDAQTGVINTEKYKETLIQQSAKLGVLQDASGTSVGQASEFYSRLLAGASAAQLRQLEFGMKNVTLMSSLENELKKRRVNNLAELSQAERLSAITEVLAKAVPEDALQRLSSTADAFKQSFLTQIVDPDVGIFGFTRQLKLGDINSSLYGQLTAAEKTLYNDEDGLYGSIKKLISAFGVTRETFDPIIPLITASQGLKETLQTVVDSINQVTLTKLAGGNPLDEVFTQIKSLSGKVQGSLQSGITSFAEGFTRTLNGLVSVGLQGINQGVLLKITEDFAKTVGTLISQGTQALSRLDWASLETASALFAEQTIAGWAKMGVSIETVTADLTRTVSGVTSVFRANLEGTLRGLQSFELEEFGPKVGEALSRLLNSAIQFPDADLVASAAGSALSGLLDGIAVFVSSINFSEVLDGVAQLLQAGLQGAGQAVDSGALSRLTEGVFSAIGQIAESTLEAATTVTSPAVLGGLIENFFGEVGRGLQQSLEGLDVTRLNSLATDLLSNLLDGVGSLGSGIADFFTLGVNGLIETAGRIDYEVVGENVALLFSKVGETLQVLADSLIGSVQDINWAEFGEAVQAFLQGTTSAFGEAVASIEWSQVVDTIIVAVETALGAFVQTITGSAEQSAEQSGNVLSEALGKLAYTFVALSDSLGTGLRRVFDDYFVQPVLDVFYFIADGIQSFGSAINILFLRMLNTIDSIRANLPGQDRDQINREIGQRNSEISDRELDQVAEKRDRESGKRAQDRAAFSKSISDRLNTSSLTGINDQNVGEVRRATEKRLKDAETAQRASKLDLSELKTALNRSFDTAPTARPLADATNSDAFNPQKIRDASAIQSAADAKKFDQAKQFLNQAVTLKQKGLTNPEIVQQLRQSSFAQDSATSSIATQTLKALSASKENEFKAVIGYLSGATKFEEKTQDAFSKRFGGTVKSQLVQTIKESDSVKANAQLKQEAAAYQAQLRPGGVLDIGLPGAKVPLRGRAAATTRTIVQDYNKETGIATVVQDTGRVSGLAADNKTKVFDRSESSQRAAAVYEYDVKNRRVIRSLTAAQSGLTVDNQGQVVRLSPGQLSQQQFLQRGQTLAKQNAGLDPEQLALKGAAGKTFEVKPQTASEILSARKKVLNDQKAEIELATGVRPSSSSTSQGRGSRLFSNGATNGFEYRANNMLGINTLTEQTPQQNPLQRALSPNTAATDRNTAAVDQNTRAMQGRVAPTPSATPTPGAPSAGRALGLADSARDKTGFISKEAALAALAGKTRDGQGGYVSLTDKTAAEKAKVPQGAELPTPAVVANPTVVSPTPALPAASPAPGPVNQTFAGTPIPPVAPPASTGAQLIDAVGEATTAAVQSGLSAQNLQSAQITIQSAQISVLNGGTASTTPQLANPTPAEPAATPTPAAVPSPAATPLPAPAFGPPQQRATTTATALPQPTSPATTETTASPAPTTTTPATQAGVETLVTSQGGNLVFQKLAAALRRLPQPAQPVRQESLLPPLPAAIPPSSTRQVDSALRPQRLTSAATQDRVRKEIGDTLGGSLKTANPVEGLNILGQGLGIAAADAVEATKKIDLRVPSPTEQLNQLSSKGGRLFNQAREGLVNSLPTEFVPPTLPKIDSPINRELGKINPQLALSRLQKAIAEATTPSIPESTQTAAQTALTQSTVNANKTGVQGRTRLERTLSATLSQQRSLSELTRGFAPRALPGQGRVTEREKTIQEKIVDSAKRLYETKTQFPSFNLMGFLDDRAAEFQGEKPFSPTAAQPFQQPGQSGLSAPVQAAANSAVEKEVSKVKAKPKPQGKPFNFDLRGLGNRLQAGVSGVANAGLNVFNALQPSQLLAKGKEIVGGVFAPEPAAPASRPAATTTAAPKLAQALKPVQPAKVVDPATLQPGRAVGESLQNYILRTEAKGGVDIKDKRSFTEQKREGALRALVAGSYANQMESSPLQKLAGLAPLQGNYSAGKGFEKVDKAAKTQLAALGQPVVPAATPTAKTTPALGVPLTGGASPVLGFSQPNLQGTLGFGTAANNLQKQASPIGEAAQIISRNTGAEPPIQQRSAEPKAPTQVNVGGITITVSGAGSPEQTAQKIAEYFDSQFAQALQGAVT